MMTKPHRTAVSSSATHVFETLHFVSDSAEPRGVTDISRQLSLPVATVFRALSTLEEAGYIQRFQNAPRFEVGTMSYLLVRALLSRFALHDDARTILYNLAEATEETVAIWVSVGWYCVLIGGAFGRRDSFHNDRLGDKGLLHQHPAGRALLGNLPNKDQQRYRNFVEKNHARHLGSYEGMHISAPSPDGIRHDKSDVLDFRYRTLLIQDPAGKVVASLVAEGPAQAGSSIDQRLFEARNLIEAMIEKDPQRYLSPFEHLDNDTIMLDLDGPENAHS